VVAVAQIWDQFWLPVALLFFLTLKIFKNCLKTGCNQLQPVFPQLALIAQLNWLIFGLTVYIKSIYYLYYFVTAMGIGALSTQLV
jgi:hypothetical protein